VSRLERLLMRDASIRQWPAWLKQASILPSLPQPAVDCVSGSASPGVCARSRALSPHCAATRRCAAPRRARPRPAGRG